MFKQLLIVHLQQKVLNITYIYIYIYIYILTKKQYLFILSFRLLENVSQNKNPASALTV